MSEPFIASCIVIGLICLFATGVRYFDRCGAYGDRAKFTPGDWMLGVLALLCPLSWVVFAVFGLVWVAERTGGKR